MVYTLVLCLGISSHLEIHIYNIYDVELKDVCLCEQKMRAIIKRETQPVSRTCDFRKDTFQKNKPLLRKGRG